MSCMKSLKALVSLMIAASIFANLITASAQSGKVVSFTVSVYSYTENGYIVEATELTHDGQISPIEVISELAGAQAEASSGYLMSAFGLAELDFGAQSGWIYKINGVSPPISAAQYKLRSGDALDWIYIVDREQYDIYPPGSASQTSQPSSGSVSTSSQIQQPGGQSSVSSVVPPQESSLPVSSSAGAAYSSGSSQQAGSSGSASYEASASSALEDYASASESMAAEGSSDTAAVSGMSEIMSTLGSAAFQPESNDDARIDAAISRAAELLQNNPGTWSALALHSIGADVSDSVKSRAESEYNASRGSDNVTSGIRALLNFAACGGEDGYIDAAKALLDSEDIDKTGVNGPVFALILLCETGICDAHWSREALSELITEYQHENGGFSLSRELEPDADITAMAVTALFLSGIETDAAERGLDYLSSVQSSSGGMSSMGQENCESAAQAIIAVISAGGSIYDDAFVKNGATLLDAMLEYECEGGGFSHIKGGQPDIMATEQALMALSAVKFREIPYSGIFDVLEDEAAALYPHADIIAASAIVIALFAVLIAAGVICYKSVSKGAEVRRR